MPRVGRYASFDTTGNLSVSSMTRLTHRPGSGVQLQRARLGLGLAVSRWTIDEDDRTSCNELDTSCDELGQQHGRCRDWVVGGTGERRGFRPFAGSILCRSGSEPEWDQRCDGPESFACRLDSPYLACMAIGPGHRIGAPTPRWCTKRPRLMPRARAAVGFCYE